MTNSIESRIPWVPVGELVPKGSIGYSLISEISTLAERPRPETIFNRGIGILWSNRELPADLKDSGITRVGDILCLKGEQVSTFPARLHIRERLINYLQGILLTPHAQLHQQIFQLPQRPASLKDERRLIDVMEDTISSLNVRRRHILQLRHGLADGIHRTFQQVADELGSKDRQGSHLIYNETLKFLYRQKQLSAYLCVPEGSYANTTFGVLFQIDDVPQFMGGPLMLELNLQTDTITVNLLPDIPLNTRQVVLVSGISIFDLDLSIRGIDSLYRRGIKTVGDLLDLSLQDFWQIKNLGNTTAREIGNLVQGLLKLSDETYPPGQVGHMLVPYTRGSRKRIS